LRFDASKNPPFDDLAAAYGRGALTPFIGAGVSAPTCPLWTEFIDRLEESAGIERDNAMESADLIRRASAAVQALRHKSPGALQDAVEEVMYRKSRKADGTMATPRATEALARVWWPLVLTTNYEALFLDAWNRRWVYNEAAPDPLPDFGTMLPVGRGRIDCQRVLNCARSPDNPLLWALQGFIGRKGERHKLASQLAIGHAEYRRQTHEAVHFRRAFAEVYRSRTLLFLGSGIRESYLLDLFGEALELLGTIDHFHYALVPRGETDPDFLQRRLQILAIEYAPDEDGGHGACVTGFLKGLREKIDGPRPRPSQWAMKLHAARWITVEDEYPDVAVVRGQMHLPSAPGTAVAVSAGLGKRGLMIGDPGLRLVRELGFDPDSKRLPLQCIKKNFVYRLEGHPLFVVVARDPAHGGRSGRDIRRVAPATVDLMTAVASAGFSRVDTMLLAAGRQRTFPQHICLREMVRGYCNWHDATSRADSIPMYIHTVDPSVLALMESRRIDLLSMIDSPRVRFWIEIRMDQEDPAPMLAIAATACTLEELMREHAIPCAGWEVSVRPAPSGQYHPQRVEALTGAASPSLADLGVLNGSTLAFLRL